MKKHLFLTFVAFFSYCIGILAQSGTCGDNLTWSIQDGTLTISGTGEMEDYSESNVPWYNYRDGITNIVINNGVTSIGDNAFRKCSALTSIEIPLGVTNIGFYSFSGCSSLKTITIPQSTKYIRTQAFLGCTALEQVICYNPNFSAFYFEDAFEEINENCVLMVPKNSIEAYADWAQYFGGGIKALEEESTEPFVDGIYYTFNEDGTSVSVTYGPDGEDTYSGNVSVPASVSILGKTYSVTGIGENAFKGCSSLTSVTLPEGLKTIGIRGFDVCTSLESINFPSTLTSIGDYAFALCNSLKTIELPEGLTSLPLGVFKDCENITSVTLPSTFKSIGIETFQNCKNLETINLPSGLTSIGESAFSGCAKLSSVEFPQNLNELGGNSFSGCTSLKSVSIPLGVKDIWTDTFASCSSLETVTFAEGLGLIGNNAFLRCSALKSVSIPSTVKELGYNAFAQCSALSEITFANGLETIGYRAFLQCSALKEITLPETVNEVKEAAFSQCYGLENVTLPEGLSKMGTYVFNSCPGLKNINIPSSLKQLPEGTFHDCYALQSVTIPKETETIAVNLLTNCQALQKVVIPAGVKTIEDAAFRGCINLTEIICLPLTPPILHEEVFKYINSSAVLNVIDAEAYADWDTYFGDGIQNIEMNGTFGEGLTWKIQKGTLTISGSGEMPGFSADNDAEWKKYKYAFTNVVIEEGIVNVGDDAFTDCANIKTVSLPSSLNRIGHGAFARCSELVQMNLPETIKSIGGSAFEGCDKLVEIENDFGYIGNWAVNYFLNEAVAPCKFRPNTIGVAEYICRDAKFSSIIFPEGFRYIGGWTFAGCRELKFIVIPESVEKINHATFLGCSNLEDVYCMSPTPPAMGSEYTFNELSKEALLHVPDPAAYEDWEPYFAAVERQNTLASGTCGENANWSLTNGVLTINGTGDMESYYLENGEDRHGPWHALKEQIYHVIIDEGITSVGDYAFYDQPEIISVSLPSTLKRIGWSAFNACTGLTGVDLPEGLEQVCPDAFYLCYSLLKEENGVNYVDDWAVSVASDNLTTIPLRPNTIGISDRFAVYKDFTNLKSVNFPKNLKYIGEEAFFYAGCTNLQNVSIPATITHIGARAFANCPGLRRVVCMNPTAITIDGGVFAADESNVSSATLYVKDPSAYEDWKPYFSQCSAMDELAMGKCGENAYWLIEDGTLTVYGTGDMESFYYEVDRFGPWYAHKDKFTKVIIEEGITNLSDYALARLDQITSVSLPSTLTSIAWCAFEGCAQLEGLAIPESVKNVGAYAFDGCDKLVEVENNIGYVGTWAVCATDQSLSSYTLRDNTTGIAGRVFYANETMTTFEFPEGVKYISMEGVGCKNLKSITLPTTIEQIAYVAFGGCSNLSEVICMSPTPPALEYAAFWTINEDATLRVPNASVYESWRPWFKTIIGENVIQGKCGDNLNWVIKDGTLVISGTGKMYDYYPDAPEDRHGPWYDYKDKFDKVVVKDGVTSLGFYAFCYSDNIVSVSLPNSLTEIQGNAFSHCPQLETINIPESVSYLAGGNFIDSPKVQEEENGILYVDSWVMGVTDRTETRAYTIRENTVGIIQNAFLGTQLNGVSFPSTLKYIGADAFAHCPNLTEVRIPATVEKIEEHVFDGCYNLVKVTFDASTPPTEVGNKKFYGLHKDATLYVPRPSAYAGWEVFFGGGIKSTLGDNLFHNGIYFAINEEERSATVTLTPEDAADYAGNIDIPNTITSNGNTYTVTGIGMRAFIDCKELTSVTLPSSVKYIGIEAFTHCENLESINLPEGLTSIGESAFSNCNKLAAIAFPQSLTEISGNAFSACTSLQTITIPSGVKGLWQDAFAWCTSLTSVTLSEGLESIGIQTFLGCKQLTEITIPESVKKIDHQAFKMCDNLLKVTLPDGLEEMGNYVFAACYNMKSINTPSILKGFPEGTFYDCCALENVKIPAASETIAVNTFWNCQSLKAVDIPESVVRIDNGAFFMTGLNSIEIPASVTYIGEQAFVNCNVLSAVIVNWERPITISSLVFREKEDSKNTIDKLYVPAGAKSAYKVSTAWSVFENIIEANLGNYFAVNDKKVNAGTSFTLPIEMVNKDEVSAFQCDIYLPEGITLQKLNARKYDVKLAEERKEDHTINVSKLSDGAVRVLVISMTSSSIIGNDGELFMLNLSAANEEIGDYTMQIKNIRISDTKGIRHDLNEVKATITLTTSGTSTDFTPADVNNDGMVAVDDVVLTINAALGIISDKFVFAAADMNGDGEILVDDVVKVINHVLGIIAVR